MKLINIAKYNLLAMILSSCVMTHFPEELQKKTPINLKSYICATDSVASRYRINSTGVTSEGSGKLSTYFQRRGIP